MAIIHVTAPAKINLFLHVTGRRADGYHLLESLAVFSEYGDRLELEPADTLSFTITGPFADALQQHEDNIVMKAARIFKERTKCKAGAHITLEKYLPVGAGLGGGSSDAAATLSALKGLWDITMNEAEMQKIALQLGSDVPVCLRRQAAWMQGAGDCITPVTVRADMWVVLVNPRIPLLTADVFRRFSGTFAPPEGMPEDIDSFDALIRFLEPKHNALETPAMALFPVISEILAAIRATQGCYLSRMSGSGATCFGLYASDAAANLAAGEIRRRYPAWWCIATRLGRN